MRAKATITGLAIVAVVAAGVCLLLAAAFLLLPRGMNGPAQQILGAATAGDLGRLKDLEARGVSLNSQDPIVFNWTPLIGAVFHGNTNIIAYLLTRNVNLDLQDREGETALIWAIRMNDTNTVRLLLDKGAGVEVADKAGCTAFGYAEGNANQAYLSVITNWLNGHWKAKR